MKIGQPKRNLDTRTKVDFLFERENILSRKPTDKICSKIKKMANFFRQILAKLGKIGHFWDRGGTIDPLFNYPALIHTARRRKIVLACKGMLCICAVDSLYLFYFSSRQIVVCTLSKSQSKHMRIVRPSELAFCIRMKSSDIRILIRTTNVITYADQLPGSFDTADTRKALEE